MKTNEHNVVGNQILDDSFNLQLEANMQNLPLFLQEVSSFAEKMGFNKKSIMHIELVLEEIIVNIISYGYKNVKNGKIIVRCCRKEIKKIEILIEDFGVPFNLIKEKDPKIDLPIEEREAGGLGIFLVKQLMEDIKYERRDKKNILTLIKNIESGE